MAIQAAQLIATVSVQGAESAESKLLSVGQTVDKTGGFMKYALAGAAIAAGVAVVGLGSKAVKMAGDFQESMTQLVTGAGESRSNLKMVSDGILKMATDTGESTKQLSDGMYMIESAGFHGAAGLDVLKASAEGAKVGNADLADVANGVTTEMTDYAKSGLTASAATNDLIATVAAGKTHMSDLSNAMAMILPTSSAVGVNLTDVSGAMATMTSEGVPAADAATYLRQMLMALESPGSKASKTLKEIGLSSSEVSDEMKKSLPDALKMITDHLKQKFPEGSAAYVNALKDIAGGSKQMQGMLDLTGDHLKTFHDNVLNISDAVKKGGKDINGWADVQKDFNTQLDRAKEFVETLGINIGTKLLPIATKTFGWIADNVGPMLKQASAEVGKLFGGLHLPSGGDFSNFSDEFSKVGSSLSKDFGPGLKYVSDMLKGEFLRELKDARDLVKNLSDFFSNQVGPALKQAAPGFQDLAKTLLNQVAPAVIGIRDKIMDVVEHAFKTFGPIVEKIVPPLIKFAGILAKDVSDALKFIMPYVDQATKAIGDFANQIIDRVAPIVKNWIEGMKPLVAGFMDWWKQNWPAISQVLKGVWDMIVGVVKIAWSIVSGVVKIGLDILGGNWKQAWEDMKDMLKGVWDGAGNLVKGGLEFIKGILQTVGKGFSDLIVSPFQSAWNSVSGIFGNIGKGINDLKSGNITGALHDFHVPGFASGTSFAPGGLGIVGERGPELMYVPRGAQIIPNNQLGSIGSPTVIVNPPPIYLDGRLLANGLMPHIVNAIRYGANTPNI